MAKAYVIDGNSLLFRAFYATYRGNDDEVLRTKDGIPTNAIFAFANMINRILSSLKEGDTIFVAFDTGHETFRHKENKDYKANRKPAPEILIEQMPIVREFLKSLNIFTYEKDGYEADDIAGTYSKLAAKEGYDVIVYTSDRDYLQLIEDKITIHILKTGMSNIMIMDEKAMMEEYGLKPLQIIDYKGLRGDASDNLPGIPGVGDKTAVKLIQEYGSFDKILEEAPNFKSKVGENIVTFQEQGKLSYRLAVIDIHMDLPFSVSDTIYAGYNFDNINQFANRYELKQFMNRLPAKLKMFDPNNVEIEYKTIKSVKEASLDLSKGIGVSLDREEGNYNNAVIYGLALTNGSTNYYINIDDLKKDEKLKEILKDEKVKKYCFDFKAIKVALSYADIEINGLEFDLLLASYLLDSSLVNNLEGVLHYFGVNLSNDNEALSLFDNSNPKRAAETSYFATYLAPKAFAELDKISCLNLYKEIEIPLANVLANMEIEGFPLDPDKLEEMGESFKSQLEIAKQNIYKYAGEEFNIDSPKQVGQILFEKLGLPSNKKNSTSVEVLKELIMVHPIIPEILTYRKYAKLLSTYVSGLVSHVYSDGKIHAMFNQAQTATGRLSSSEPNLQNISVRDEEGKLIRKAFYYKDENYSILSLDYSQIELRILASLSKCQKLIDVFKRGEDIHASTAKNVFHVENPTSEQRRKAKAVNFGIIYGISDWGLSEQIGTSFGEAKKIIDNFYTAYPEIGLYFKGVVDSAIKNGYATTLLGRRRYLREIHDTNYQVREFARRAAMNAPIQGTAADLIKIAMIKTFNALKEKGLKTKLVLQIHDELLFKVPNEEKEEVFNLVKSIMENALELDVKLEVDGGFGRTWYDAK